MLDKLAAVSAKGAESLKNVFNEASVNNLKESSPLSSSMELLENSSLERLKAVNESITMKEVNAINSKEIQESTEGNESVGLSEQEKQKIKEETGWSDEIIDALGSMEEYQVYRDAELQEVEINGRKCLVRNDIDWEQTDSMARTNRERSEAGLSPININGDTIELHHIGQKNDGALAELTPEQHRGKENYSVLHDTQKESEIDRVAFNGERSSHWKERVGEESLNA